jgi:hypothetical protein
MAAITTSPRSTCRHRRGIPRRRLHSPDGGEAADKRRESPDKKNAGDVIRFQMRRRRLSTGWAILGSNQ